MRYVDLRGSIKDDLLQCPPGFTWEELRERLQLPHDRPCGSWVRRMQREMGLTRARGSGRAYIWTLLPRK